MTRRPDRERGAASIWVLAMGAVVLAVAVVVGLYGSAATARHRASAAADLAALAAADRLWTGKAGEPCRTAAEVARRNGARLTGCLTSNGVADISTRVRLGGALTRLGDARARARAVPGTVGGPFAVASTVEGDAGAGPMGADGLTPRARRVRDLIRSEFGESDIGGYCPGGCSSGHIAGSDHYSGRAVDVMITPWRSPARVAKGWRLASWVVGNARPLHVKYVIYRDRIWTPGRGWHAYRHPSGDTSNPTLRHLDHVHVSVY
ncbi:MAG: hypothetical protein GEV10_06205 [Streptosporangiales bacterium]|nr:hypothetical protein [Streptosporangiales bacterium]